MQYLTAQGTATGKSGPSAGYVISILLLLTSIASSICIHQQYAECNRVGIKVRAAISGLVYRKSLRLSRVKGGAGEVINIISADVTRINDAVVNFHFLWSAFVEVALIIILAFYEIGLSAFPAVFFILVLLPIQMYLGRRTSTLSRCQTEQGTIRVHNMSEILTAIKLIKFYAWELPFTEQVSAIREKEMGYIYANMMNKTVNYTVVFAIPVLAALSSLTMYVKYDRPLTASVSFTVLSLFNTLRYPFFMLPMAVKATAGAVTSFARLDRFMALEEVVPLNILKPPTGSDLAFEMNDCDFNWDGAEGDKPALSRISLKVKRGQKVAIVGDVGCGKSSLLAALLGQIRQTRGEPVKMYGTTAYMSQEAWLLNLTLRDNVTFGKPYDIARYKETIRVCSLQRDLTLLISGDRTEIAERGANLSGGQRQRVSLARTVYYDADILLLDDPLSAVDQHVGRHIFEECFQKNLKDKTVIVVLNQLQYLESMDYVVFVKDGAIKSQGSYDYLITTDELFKDMVASQVADSDEIEDPAFDEGEPMNVPDFDPDAIAPREPLESEDYMGSNDLLVPPAKTAKDSNSNRFLAMNSLSVSNRSQLAAMVKINESTVRSMIGRQNVTTISGAERDHDIAKVMMRNELSTYSVHHFKNALKEEAEEEDKAAIAKGKLVVEDDSTKTAGAGDFAAYAREGSGTTVTILMMITFVLVHGIRISGDFWLRLWVPRIGDFTDEVYIGVYAAFTALFSIGVFFRGYFFTAVTAHKAVKLHDKLFDATMHAPMSFFDTTPVARLLAAFSKHALHVDDTMPDAGMQALQYFPLGLGALLICAILIPWNWAPCIGVVLLGCLLLRYSTTADFATKSLEATTKPPIFSHLTCTLEGLFSIRAYHAEKRFDDMNLARLDTNHENLFAMQSVKSFQALYLDILSSLVIFFSALLLVFVRDTNGIASVAGLALSNALQMLVFVQWTVRQWGEVETQMSSVGQLVYYGKTQPEAPFDIPATKPPSTWPSAGLIKFQNIELKYQKFGVSVLKNISCTIYPREKIGIVGRTGSGKSTLLVSLLRIVESYEGMITIDDVDVSKIGI